MQLKIKSCKLSQSFAPVDKKTAAYEQKLLLEEQHRAALGKYARRFARCTCSCSKPSCSKPTHAWLWITNPFWMEEMGCSHIPLVNHSMYGVTQAEVALVSADGVCGRRYRSHRLQHAELEEEIGQLEATASEIEVRFCELVCESVVYYQASCKLVAPDTGEAAKSCALLTFLWLSDQIKPRLARLCESSAPAP